MLKTTSSISSKTIKTTTVDDDLILNTNRQAKLISLNYTPSNKSSSPLLNLKSPNNNKSLIKQQISSKDNTEKFRYFYQIRRNNGDVLSKDFLNNLQQKKENEQSQPEGNTSPHSTSSTNSKLNSKKSSSKKSTNSNSSCSTTTTMTRVI